MLRAKVTMLLAAFAVAAASVVHAEPRAAGIEEAGMIHHALPTGELQVSQLTPQQMAELAELDRHCVATSARHFSEVLTPKQSAPAGS